MGEIEKQREQFLDEMIQYYSEDVSRRAVSSGSCFYRVSDGRKCAIGRFIPDDKYKEDFEGKGAETVFPFLPLEIQQLESDFFGSCQSLHDSQHYWDKYGLTKSGIDRVQQIKEWYCS